MKEVWAQIVVDVQSGVVGTGHAFDSWILPVTRIEVGTEVLSEVWAEKLVEVWSHAEKEL